MLAYLTLMGDQRMDYWDQLLASEVICNHIPFAGTLAACRERYPSGRIAGLLDVMEQEHAASIERKRWQNQ